MSEYANIDRVYRTVKFFFNKEQHGNLKVDEFNRFADYVQKSLTSEIMQEYRTALRLRKSKAQHSGGLFRSYNDILQDIRTLHISQLSLSVINGTAYSYPSDYMYYTSFMADGVPCDVMTQDDEMYNYIVNSQLAQPSPKFPIVALRNDDLLFLPSTVSATSLSYYKIPQGTTNLGVKTTQPPTWAYNVVSGVDVYNATNSINFELPINVENRLAIGILECFGINMREQQIAQYAMSKGQEQDAKEMQ